MVGCGGRVIDFISRAVPRISGLGRHTACARVGEEAAQRAAREGWARQERYDASAWTGMNGSWGGSAGSIACICASGERMRILCSAHVSLDSCVPRRAAVVLAKPADDALELLHRRKGFSAHLPAHRERHIRAVEDLIQELDEAFDDLISNRRVERHDDKAVKRELRVALEVRECGAAGNWADDHFVTLWHLEH